jgi:IS5 family transposase
VSLADPDARPIRKGRLGKPNEFGYVSQICEVTEHNRRGARGLIIPAATRLGNPAEDTLVPDTIWVDRSETAKPRRRTSLRTLGASAQRS